MNEITNKNYIEEMERNSKIFEEKMNKLNSDNYEDDHAYSNNTKMISYNTYNAYNTYNTLNNDRQYIKKNLNRKVNNNLKKIDFSKNNPFKDEKEQNYFSFNKNEEKENNYKYNKSTKHKIISNNNYSDNYNSYISDDKKLIEEIKEKIIKKNKKNNSKTKEKENLKNDTLKSKNIQIKIQDEDIMDLKMRLDSIYAQNKNMKAVIEKKNNEIDNLKLALKDMKEEIKLSKNKYNDFILKQRQLQQDYDKLNKEYISVKTEKENMKLILDDQKSTEINLKKEVNDLKKIIKKLNEQLKEAAAIKIKNNILNSDRQKDKENTIYTNNNNNNGNEPLKKNLYKSQFNNNRDKNNCKNNHNEYKSNKKNNNNKMRYTETEDKIIYNNNDDDYSDEDDYINKVGVNNKKKLFNSIDNNHLKISHHIKNKNINNIKPIDNMNYINREENSDKNLKNKNINGKKILSKNKDKKIEGHKDKIKELIDNNDFQNVEKELKILKKEKEKLEIELLKIPDPPRKLSDIKNKKEINDSVNEIERDINYISSLLKNKDAH